VAGKLWRGAATSGVLPEEPQEREEGEEEMEEEMEEVEEWAAMQLAIVGRPNAGKSTLVNRLLGQERVLTGPERGLTRDSIRLPTTHDGRAVWLVDTAGWERKALLRHGGSLSALPGEQAKKALNRAHVVAVMLDGGVYLHEGRLLRSEVRDHLGRQQYMPSTLVGIKKVSELDVSGQGLP